MTDFYIILLFISYSIIKDGRGEIILVTSKLTNVNEETKLNTDYIVLLKGNENSLS